MDNKKDCEEGFYDSHFICEGSMVAYVGNGSICLEKLYDRNAIEADIKSRFTEDFPKFKYFESLRVMQLGSGWKILIPGEFGFTGEFDAAGFLID